MASSIRAYTLGEGLSGLAAMAIQSHRAPTVRDHGQIGQIWVNMNNNNYYVLTSATPTVFTWSSITNGAGLFNTITTVTTVTAGTAILAGTTVTATTDVVAGHDVIAGNDVVATNGNVDVLAGDVNVFGVVNAGRFATIASVTANQIVIDGDGGFVGAGTMVLTNAANVAPLGAGALTLLSTTANPGTNAGYLKLYLGVDTIWVPYFLNIAP